MFNKNQIEKFLRDSVDGKVTVEKQVKFLEHFTPDRINAEQIKIFADFMMKNASAKLRMPGCMDICGTGGSGLERINTSTISAFLLAELGVKIAKHGNKAASGRFGSFDLLESLGVDIEKNPDELEAMYRKTGLAFIFARSFHPAMKYFAEARKAIGKPTIFNILGPLLNPANPPKQIIGTSFKSQMRIIAEACKLMGKKNVMVVRGEDGLDEVTLCGKTDVVELRDGKIIEYVLRPADFGIEECSFDEIKGGDESVNKKIAIQILNGDCETRHADLVYANSALALKLSGKTDDLKEAYRLTKGTIGTGKLEAYKENILEEIAASKMPRKSERSFLRAVQCKGKDADAKCKNTDAGRIKLQSICSLILEIKKSSPSSGKIFKGYFSAGKIAQTYEKNGASAISVLTDEKYFNGSFDYLREAKAATKTVPILCKDFIVNEYQIFKAREYGADAILLIVALLPLSKLKKFIAIARSLGMDSLVEVHDEKEIAVALRAGAKIIGINNRNLKTFKIDTDTTNRLIKKIPKNIAIVSESGLDSNDNLRNLNKRVDAVLIGTAIMKSNNISKKIHEIIKAISAK